MGQRRKHSNIDIYNFIVKYKAENDGLSPSLREIRQGVNISTLSIVSGRLIELRDQGYIKFEDNIARSIKVVGGKWELIKGEIK